MRNKAKRKSKTFNDGIVLICQESKKDMSLNAKVNPITLDDFTTLASLRFNEENIRIQDTEFAESNDFSLSLKISTPLIPIKKMDYEAIIGNQQYHVNMMDFDRKDEVTYWYLEEVRTIDQ